ncbi:MAG: GspMb/PilO family protein [Pseudomonadota bacterium]
MVAGRWIPLLFTAGLCILVIAVAGRVAATQNAVMHAQIEALRTQSGDARELASAPSDAHSGIRFVFQGTRDEAIKSFRQVVCGALADVRARRVTIQRLDLARDQHESILRLRVSAHLAARHLAALLDRLETDAPLILVDRLVLKMPGSEPAATRRAVKADVRFDADLSAFALAPELLSQAGSVAILKRGAKATDPPDAGAGNPGIRHTSSEQTPRDPQFRSQTLPRAHCSALLRTEMPYATGLH